MSFTNKRTLQAYEEHLSQYVDNTPSQMSETSRDWIHRALKGLDKNARILEVGSGFGRDAEYIESHGYKVQRTDAAVSFVNFLNKKNLTAKVLNILTDDLGGPYDLIFANAVLLHLTRPEMSSVLDKIYKSLSPGGRLAFTLKEGQGQEWNREKMGVPRFVCYWKRHQLEPYLNKAKFSNVQIESDKAGAYWWLHVVAIK